VWIELRRTENGVILSARDDGRGAAALVAGHGMTGMRERVQAVGGSVETTTAPGLGFEVRVWVPTATAAI
jgi:signal transduction histidine kinase